jgi:hypothetical protein
MASSIQFHVDNTLIPLGAIWAHTKSRPRGRTSKFTFTVPLAHAAAVFAPTTTKTEAQSWSDFVRNQIEEMRELGMGSMNLQSWLSHAGKIEQVRRQPCQWVICSVGEVTESDSAVTVTGVAEQFAPKLY